MILVSPFPATRCAVDRRDRDVQTDRQTDGQTDTDTDHATSDTIGRIICTPCMRCGRIVIMIMAFGDHQILFSEGAQQGDPLGSLQFCEVIHPLLCGLQSEVKLGFMDDVTLSGEMSTVEEDVCTILQASAETGLYSQYCQVRNNNGGLHSNSIIISSRRLR